MGVGAPRTVGVEEEFLLVRAGSARLSASGDEVVATAAAGSSGQFEHELQREQAELGTRPTRSTVVLATELRQRRAELAAAAERLGARLLASATSPVDEHASTTREHRYEQMTRVFGRVARRQLTCGMHVHVAIDSPAEGVAALDWMRPWLAVLVALSANSPFVGGEDTGYASYRTVLWGQWPTAGVADPFGNVDGYERALADLLASGAALDDGMIYFDARLSARYPTVEVRVADVCMDVADAVTIAALTRALVATSTAGATPPVRGELLRAATSRAARYGVEDTLVDPVTAQAVPAWQLVERLTELVDGALGDAGDRDLVHSGLNHIRRRGTGARRQREAFGRAGSVAAVVDAIAVATVT